MTSTLPATRELTQRLITLEAHAAPITSGRETARVVEKLRLTLTKFAGVAGYRTLLMRALALAKAEVPSLAPLQVHPDGSLDGFDNIGQETAGAASVVITYLLSLLVAFIGRTLTISLIRDTWPDASLDEKVLRAEEEL